MPSHNKKQNHKILAPLRGVHDPLIASSPIAISNSLRYKVEDYVSIIIDNSTLHYHSKRNFLLNN